MYVCLATITIKVIASSDNNSEASLLQPSSDSFLSYMKTRIYVYSWSLWLGLLFEYTPIKVFQKLFRPNNFLLRFRKMKYVRVLWIGTRTTLRPIQWLHLFHILSKDSCFHTTQRSNRRFRTWWDASRRGFRLESSTRRYFLRPLFILVYVSLFVSWHVWSLWHGV